MAWIVLIQSKEIYSNIKPNKEIRLLAGLGFIIAHQSGSGETVISFVNIEENGGGSITVRRNNAFSFTYAYFGEKEYQFFNGWALCRQLIYVVGMVGGAIYLIPWVFGMKENDDKSIE